MNASKKLNHGEVVATELGKRIDAYLNRAVLFGFVGSVLVAKADDVLLCKGYDLANIAKGIPFTPETIIDIGSLSKQFTATAIVHLEQQGLISVCDPITRFFEDVPSDKREITLYHLLTHTSGLPLKHGSDFEYYERTAFIQDVLARPLAFRPGTEYKYSNPAFALLAVIVEDITGQPFQDYLTETFFKPVGLEYAGWYGDPRWTEEQVAHVYVEGEDGGSPRTWPGPYRPLIGNGGVCCTVGELYRWVQAIKNGQILNEESIAKLFTPFLEDTAFGWDVLDTPYGRRIWHNGGTDSGANSEFYWFKDLDLFIIIFSNHIRFGEDVGYMAIWPIRSILFGNSYESPPRLSQNEGSSINLQDYIGIYALTDDTGFEVTVNSNFLLLASLGQPAMDLCVFPDQESPEKYDFYNQTSRTVVEQLMQGKFTVLKELASQKSRFPLLRSFLQRWIRDNQSKAGPCRNFKVLGTTPFKEFYDTTWVQLEFAEGRNGFGIVWGEEKLIRLTETFYLYPVIIPFLPKSESEFIGHSLLFSRTMRIDFDRTPEGIIEGFHIHNGVNSHYILKKSPVDQH